MSLFFALMTAAFVDPFTRTDLAEIKTVEINPGPAISVQIKVKQNFKYAGQGGFVIWFGAWYGCDSKKVNYNPYTPAKGDQGLLVTYQWNGIEPTNHGFNDIVLQPDDYDRVQVEWNGHDWVPLDPQGQLVAKNLAPINKDLAGMNLTFNQYSITPEGEMMCEDCYATIHISAAYPDMAQCLLRHKTSGVVTVSDHACHITIWTHDIGFTGDNFVGKFDKIDNIISVD